MSEQVVGLFAYGTLMRGEVREFCWPRPSVSVTAATIRAALYSLGPYPAILLDRAEPNDRVLGELWMFDPPALIETLEVLDEVEGYQQPGESDQYVRDVVDVTTLEGESFRAYVYRYVQKPLPTEGMRIRAAQHEVAGENGLIQKVFAASWRAYRIGQG